MRFVWIVWFLAFLALEGYAIRKGKPTLSATWWWLRDIAPSWVAVIMSAALGATLLWLFTIHWLFTIIDKPGLDRIEVLILIAGAILGGLSGTLAKRKEHNMKANPAVKLLLGIDTDVDCSEAYQKYRSSLDLKQFKKDVQAAIEADKKESKEDGKRKP